VWEYVVEAGGDIVLGRGEHDVHRPEGEDCVGGGGAEGEVGREVVGRERGNDGF
jgi:hypothetical protein